MYARFKLILLLYPHIYAGFSLSLGYISQSFFACACTCSQHSLVGLDMQPCAAKEHYEEMRNNSHIVHIQRGVASGSS